MSASTVSITTNAPAATRRRHGENKSTDAIDFASDPDNFTGAVLPALEKVTVSGDASLRAEAPANARDAVVQDRKPLSSTTATTRRASTAVARKRSAKVVKPWWMTVIRVVRNTLLLLPVLLSLVQTVRRFILKNGGTAAVDLLPGDFKGNMEMVEEFMRSTMKSMKMLQVQVDVLDRKIGDEIDNAKKEVGEKLEGKGLELEAKLKELGGRTVSLESFLGDFRGKMVDWLSREELNEFVEEFKKTKSGDAATLDEVRTFAKEVVEKEIQKHAADGIGRVDYALATAGGLVLKHSEAFAAGGLLSGNGWGSLTNLNKVFSDAEKMLLPSFGEPGQCFPLKGSSGFVQIKLMTPIIPEAVTLEHVAKSVAYDGSSAPKNCRVFGWLEHGLVEPSVDTERMVLLAEFMYDLERSNIQTFDVADSARSSVVNLIQFEFTSNHGNANHTCIYRLRVHGREPHSVSKMAS